MEKMKKKKLKQNRSLRLRPQCYTFKNRAAPNSKRFLSSKHTCRRTATLPTAKMTKNSKLHMSFPPSRVQSQNEANHQDNSFQILQKWSHPPNTYLHLLRAGEPQLNITLGGHIYKERLHINMTTKRSLYLSPEWHDFFGGRRALGRSARETSRTYCILVQLNTTSKRFDVCKQLRYVSGTNARIIRTWYELVQKQSTHAWFCPSAKMHTGGATEKKKTKNPPR